MKTALAPEPSPLWPLDSPVGTERVGDQSVGMPDPNVSPVIGLLGDRPVTAADQASALRIASAASQFGPADVGAIKAFHGSPADFNAFSDKYIGTGEGAQAFGRGHYSAGAESTGQYYKDVLTREKGLSTVWKDRAGNTLDFADLAQGPPTDPTAAAANWMKQRSGPDAGITPALDDVLKTKPEDFVGGAAERQATIDGLMAWERRGVGQRPGGHMYELAIHADPEHLLDWDKPLSEQSQHVQDALIDWNSRRPVGEQLPTHVFGQRQAGQPLPDLVEPSGAGIYKHFSSVGGNDPAAAAKALHAAGIPGIKYLDQGSRSSGQGTSNYVIFDPKTIEILRKYGIAGLIAGGGAAAATQRQDQ